MAQVSRRMKVIRLILLLVLLASLLVGGYAMWQMLFPQPLMMSSANGVDAGGTPTKSFEGLSTLIVSTITSVTSVLALAMSKYTEWQRARLEHKKLDIELQQKELELKELRRKLQDA